jgi:hypothetical protein
MMIMTVENNKKMGNKIIRVSKPFILGKCRCGCGGDFIHLRSGHGLLQRFVKGHHRRDKPSGNFRGGRYLSAKGWFVFKPGYFSSYKKGHVLEHQFIFQEYHKCCMLPWGVIRHINGNRLDNRIENLEGMTVAQSIRLYWLGRKRKGKNSKSMESSS